MKKWPLTLSTCAVAMAVAAGLAPVHAAEGEKSCERRVVAKGFPNKTESMASLSAVRLWSENTKDKLGPDFAMWHNADAHSVKCSPVNDSNYYACIAIGRPCKMHAASAETDKSAQNTR